MQVSIKGNVYSFNVKRHDHKSFVRSIKLHSLATRLGNCYWLNTFLYICPTRGWVYPTTMKTQNWYNSRPEQRSYIMTGKHPQNIDSDSNMNKIVVQLMSTGRVN